jgi:nitrous oxidase accessory protein NosD
MPGVFKIPGTYDYHHRTHMWEADTRTRYTLAADLAAVARYPASFWHTRSEVFFHTSDNGPPQAHDIGIGSAFSGIVIWRPKTTLRGLQFRNFLGWRWSCGVELRGPDTSVEDCRVSNSVRGIQIMMQPPGTRVVRCHVEDCGGGIYSQGTGAVIEDCRFYKVRDAFMVPVYSQDDTAIQFYFPASGGEVRRNLGVGFANGIFIKCGSSRFVVEHNTMVDGISYGIGCTEWHGESVFQYNIATGFSDPILWPHHLEPTSVVDLNCFWGGLSREELQRFLDAPVEFGTGKHTIAADPRFAAPAAGDYRLLPDSPALRMGPEGRTCGAFGAVGPDFDDVQPPELTVSAAEPARRALGSGGLYFDRDPWLGGSPSRIATLPEEENGGEWLTQQRKVTLEIQAQDAVTKPSKLQIRLGAGPWGETEPFRPRLAVELPDMQPIAPVAVRVSDAAGNWSKPVSLLFRRVQGGPELMGEPFIHTNDNGALIAFTTDRPCRVRAEFGPDRKHGSAVLQPEGAQRTWLGDGPDWFDARSSARVANHFVITRPLVESGGTYHYRLLLEDALGNETATDDAAFTVKGPPRSWFVSLDGQDANDGGSRDRPVRTIQFAVDRALPGDRVVLLPGLYPGETTLTHGGLDGAPITIEAEEAGTVTLDARHELSSCLRLIEAPNVVIRGLVLRWFGKADTFYCYRKSGVYIEDSANVSVRNCRIWNDFWMGWPIGSGICVLNSPGLVADHNVIYQMEQGIFLSRSPRARVTHNTILMNLYGAVKFLHSAENSVSLNNSFAFSGNDQYLVEFRDEREFQTFRSDFNNVGTKLRNPDPGDDIVPDHPFFRGHGSKAVISLNGGRYNSLRAWQQATGKDLNSIFRDPKYVDPEGWDYRPKPDSPNIGAGEGGTTIGALEPDSKGL